MITTNTTTKPLFLSLAAAMILSSCKQTENAVVIPTESKLSSILLSEEPSDATSISAAFTNPTPGTKVTLTGEVMGRIDPFIENRAMLLLGDPSQITPCHRIEGDSCETPWDVCCDDPDTIKVSTATIQVLDENQRPLKENLKGLSGIKELTTLTVVGTIAEGSNAENLLVTASGIFVGKTDPFPAH